MRPQNDEPVPSIQVYTSGRTKVVSASIRAGPGASTHLTSLRGQSQNPRLFRTPPGQEVGKKLTTFSTHRKEDEP